MAEKSKKAPKKMPKQMERQQQQQRQDQGMNRAGSSSDRDRMESDQRGQGSERRSPDQRRTGQH
ncbi:hypothetical protein [Nocardia anaemiae]|uniref:hypothetical protein n=1 Tax=Nocardia anaemiae TaxID=263910 RepID=UPI000AFE37B2|nr:hypothetical protein [Nocardia anaemiae]